jgi:hypothetical protein
LMWEGWKLRWRVLYILPKVLGSRGFTVL